MSPYFIQNHECRLDQTIGISYTHRPWQQFLMPYRMDSSHKVLCPSDANMLTLAMYNLYLIQKDFVQHQSTYRVYFFNLLLHTIIAVSLWVYLSSSYLMWLMSWLLIICILEPTFQECQDVFRLASYLPPLHIFWLFHWAYQTHVEFLMFFRTVSISARFMSHVICWSQITCIPPSIYNETPVAWGLAVAHTS